MLAPVMQAISFWNVWQIRNESLVKAAVNGSILGVSTLITDSKWS